MWLDSAKAFFAKISIPLLAVSSCVFAQAPSDSSVARPDSVVDADLLLLSNMQEIPDSVAAVPVAADSAAPVASASAAPVLKNSTAPTALPSGPLKSVLYLGGGKNSAWYHLGVLYAIEGYSIPVDSVVGVSWGAFVGFLWAKGMPLDDIQRVLLDPYIADIVGQNEMDDLYDDAERTVTFRRLPFSVRSVMQTGRNPKRTRRITIAAIVAAGALAAGAAAWLLAPDERVEVVERTVTSFAAIEHIDRQA
jgi:NTE family protein